ncbi:hypothetical protein [Amycolatopsis anabasis]|uniref:hypothetical protein n=1 Tax=Amycolatopsis anabasis TaxID=1840409 RepID=UPI00131AA90C|nr:hypothetical protein [Amycolatopsis anabasis]
MFGIEGYRPEWLNGLRAIEAAHRDRLGALIGRRLSHAWLVWDAEDDEWFADGPVLLDFEGERAEVAHQKFDELSITWNTMDPGEPIARDEFFDLRWRDDAHAELAALHGEPLRAVEFLEWSGDDLARGMVAVSFLFTRGQVTISNGLDENQLDFGPPDPCYRCHPLNA